MTIQERRQYVASAMRMRQGDDLERANIHFSGYSEKELDAPHGASGKTRREIWNEYKQDRAKHHEVVQWLGEVGAI